MKILFLACAALVIQLFLFLCTGSVVMRVRGKDEYSLSSALLLGYFTYFGIFEVIHGMVEHMKKVLEACDRRKAGQTVSPYGLTLMGVDYP